MKKWNKEEALNYLDTLIQDISSIKISRRESSEHIRWLGNTLRFLEEVFGEKSLYYLNISNMSWRQTGNMFLSDPRFLEDQIKNKHESAFKEQMEKAKGFLMSAKDQLERNAINDVYTHVSEKTNNIIKILKLGESKLRKLIRTDPSTEREIQDKYEDLLTGSEIEYSREFPHIEYSSKQYIPDFSFSEFDLVVELKLCKSDAKKLIGQLNDDILAYKTKFNNIIFIIYDLGQIRDIDSFKSSFEKQENVFIQIIKH
jgi:hypothetical protein